jgi:hypothetical protein
MKNDLEQLMNGIVAIQSVPTFINAFSKEPQTKNFKLPWSIYLFHPEKISREQNYFQHC